MKRLLGMSILMVVAMVGVFGAVAGYAASADDVTVGVVINTLRHPYYVQLVDAYKTAAAELGISIIVKDPDADSNRQVSMIQELISVQRVDALCVDPCVPGTLAGVIEEATAAGIPVITGAGHAAGETCFVGSDNYVGGRLAGVFAGQWLQQNVVGRSPVIAIAESTRYPIPNLRISGFLEGINEFVSDAIIVIRDTDATKLDAMAKVEDILSQYDRVDCTFGINDAASLGALAACESKFGATAMVSCGFDCDPDGIATLQSEDHTAFMADVAQYPYLIARISLVQAVKAARGEEVPARIWAPCQLATRDNVDEILANPPAVDDSYINF